MWKEGALVGYVKLLGLHLTRKLRADRKMYEAKFSGNLKENLLEAVTNSI